MATPGRGGYQRPKGPRPPAGPGRFSERTDANQPPRTPGLASPDIQYGDVGRLEEAQRAVPLPGARTQVPAARPEGAAMGEGRLPSWLFDLASGRPGEPLTAGLDVGPGAGADPSLVPTTDVRELVLSFVATSYQNADAGRMLEALRAERGALAQPAPGLGAQMPPAVGTPAGGSFDEGAAVALPEPGPQAEVPPPPPEAEVI